jgi:hypothetical protein
MTSKARKFASLVRTRAAEVGQASLAASAGVDTATVSRWFSDGRIDQFCAAVEAAGLKIIPAEFRCVRSSEELEHLMYWAKKGMESVKSAADLFEDEE